MKYWIATLLIALISINNAQSSMLEGTSVADAENEGSVIISKNNKDKKDCISR